MNIWKVLDIEETKDKNVIRDAYRKKLVLVNPEEDQQGFMELRRAYEQAMAAADRTEEENGPGVIEKEEGQNTPIGLWIKSVDALYQDIRLRGNVEKWKELLEQDICFSLETKTEVRDELLKYLMSHNYLPQEIWKLLDDRFLLREYREELYEKFPADYIDQGVIQNIEYKEFIEIQYTESIGGRDYDQFYSKCYELYHLLVEGNTEEAEQKFSQLEELKIYHPYVDVLRIRYLLMKEEIEEAEELIGIIKEKLPEDIQVLRAEADTYLVKKEYDKAKAAYKNILKLFPDHYNAKVALGDICIELKEYKEAKEYYDEAYDIHKNDYLGQEILNCAEKLEKIYYQRWEENPHDLENAIELARAYYQQSKFKQSLKILLDMVPDEENQLEHVHLTGCNYMYMQEYEKSLPYLKQWVRETEKLKEDGTEKRKKAIKRLSMAYQCTAQALAGLKKYEEADEYLERALATGIQTIDVYEEKARFCFFQKKYDDVLKICDKILEYDRSSPIAYGLRAEIFYERSYYLDSLREWDCCIKISPNNLSYYIKKTDCLYLMEKYDEALEVLNYVKENGAESDSIVMWEAMIKGAKGNQEEALKTLLDISIRAEAAKDFEQAIVHRLYFEIGRIYAHKEQNDEAKFYLDKALKANPHFVRGIIFKGNIYWLEKDFEAALTCFLQALEEEPGHEKINGWIGEVYEDKKEYENAITYYTKQLEIAPNAFIYLSRGWCYEGLKKYGEAKQDYKKSIQLDPNNGNTYCLLANCYMWEEQDEKAMEYFKEGFEKNDKEPIAWQYRCYIQCCRRLQKWDKAIALYNRCIVQVQNPFDRKKLGELYMVMGQYEQALAEYTQYGRFGEQYRVHMIKDMVRCLLHMKRIDDAEQIIQKEFGDIFLAPDMAERDYNARIMDIYLYLTMKKIFHAKREYKRMLRKICRTKAGEPKRIIYLKCYFALRGKKNRKIYDKSLKGHICSMEKEAKEMVLDSPEYIAKRDSSLALAELARDHYEKAMEYAQSALTCKRCRDCSFCQCIDALFVKAMVLEITGRLEEALACYVRLMNLDGGDLDYIMAYERLYKKMN